MIQKFIENGYKIVENHEKADIYIINTCTVTNMSDRKSRQMIRRAKEINPEAIIIAVGCYVQVAKKEIENIKEIDLALGNEEKVDIVKYCNEIIQKNKKEEIADVMQSRKFAEFGETSYTEKTRAVIKVQDGCDRFCSYCIIPYARGRVRSREPEHIIKEIKQIANEGIKEVVITGIHIASYGKDFKKDYKLIDLLEKDVKIALSNSKKGYMMPCDIWHLEEQVKDVLSIGNQTGEGWFLTAEMIEYIENNIPNIVCVQPFACLPNHVVGKGVIKTIREKYPDANISPVDYDPGASEVNQANRIKLLMTVAKDNLKKKESEKHSIDLENKSENNLENKNINPKEKNTIS